MAERTSTNQFPAQMPLFGDLEKHWGWLLAFGILSIVLGTIGLGMSFWLTEVSVVFFGALLIVGGVFQVLDAVGCHGWKSIVWHVVIGLLYVAAGVIVVLNPVAAALSLTLALGIILIAVGILRAIMSFELKPAPGWFWALLSGLVSIVLGGMILAEWPQTGFWIIGLFIAVELIFNGWTYLFVAFAARAAGKAHGRTA